jgi:soluble cytochrome b562
MKTVKKSNNRWSKKNKKEKRWIRSIKQKQSYYKVEEVSQEDKELTEYQESRQISWRI